MKFDDPWSWMQPYDIRRFGEIIQDKTEQERWCRCKVGTGAAAAQRGYYLIYPVDCLLSESAFREAYAAWQMAGGGPPVTTKWVTVTRSDMITFENANR